MLIDLSEVLSEPHKSIDEVVGTEMKEVKVNGSRFPVSRTQPVHIHVEYAGEKKLHISCETSLTVIIPCDRCLTDVPTDFTLSFEKQVIQLWQTEKMMANPMKRITLTDIILMWSSCSITRF